jgi:phosphoribosylanthranilate isomerase
VKRPIIKICCISSHDEAAFAVQAGAQILGLVSTMPSGPGVIDETLIASIARATPAHIKTFLLTALTDAGSIAAQHARCRTTSLQLVDRVGHSELQKLRVLLPDIELVQVIHVSGEESINEAVSVAPLVDAILLDSGNQKLAVKELGGTGRTHDWRISRRIRDAVECPVFLAGGLNSENVASAIDEVDPDGLDICSGVRTNGALDPQKVSAFFANLL